MSEEEGMSHFVPGQCGKQKGGVTHGKIHNFQHCYVGDSFGDNDSPFGHWHQAEGSGWGIHRPRNSISLSSRKKEKEMTVIRFAGQTKGGSEMGLVLLAPALILLMIWALWAVNQTDDDD